VHDFSLLLQRKKKCVTKEVIAVGDQGSLVSMKAKDFMQLMKFRLSSLVVFSAITAYIMASASPQWHIALLLVLGGFLVTGSSNAFNQIIERDLDKLMQRTENRPLPQERLGHTEAIIFSTIIGVSGICILWFAINPLSGILGIAALVSYVAIYTPLKRITPFAVFVGAFPGAIPPLLGWVAATGELQFQGLILFAIQFIWQFPHFWALAWIADEDYKRAGFQMLPAADGRSKTTAFQILIYNAGLIPIGLLPYAFHMSGVISAVITTLCAVYFFYRAVRLHKTL